MCASAWLVASRHIGRGGTATATASAASTPSPSPLGGRQRVEGEHRLQLRRDRVDAAGVQALQQGISRSAVGVACNGRTTHAERVSQQLQPPPHACASRNARQAASLGSSSVPGCDALARRCVCHPVSTARERYRVKSGAPLRGIHRERAAHESKWEQRGAAAGQACSPCGPNARPAPFLPNSPNEVEHSTRGALGRSATRGRLAPKRREERLQQRVLAGGAWRRRCSQRCGGGCGGGCLRPRRGRGLGRHGGRRTSATSGRRRRMRASRGRRGRGPSAAGDYCVVSSVA